MVTRVGGGLAMPAAPAPAARASRTPQHVPSASGAPVWVVAVAAVASAVVAVLVSRHVFPYLSVDNDEALYRMQAQALAHGHLFPPAADPAASSTPWLGVVSGHHYVLKYTPLVPGLLAVGLVLVGSVAPVLAVLAAAAVGMTYLLAAEVTGERVVGATAAVLVAASPLVVVQSGLLLPYLPSLVLLEAVAWALSRAMRARPGGAAFRRHAALAGLALGLVVTVRPYDAVLFTLPVVVWTAWTLRRAGGTRAVASAALWVLAGAALPLAGLLAYDAAATGSPLRLPFSLLERQDALGFGVRRLYPSDRGHVFGLVDGLRGVGWHLRLLGGWAFGGAGLAVLALASAARRRVGGAGVALLAGGGLLSLGYVGFWGAYNAAVLWGGVHYVGPFYLMPVLVPLVVLGARGLVDLARWRPATGVLAVLAGVGLSLAVLVPAVSADLTLTAQDSRLARLTAGPGAAGRRLVFVAVDPPFLMHPSAVLSNPATGVQRVAYAVARGGDDFRVLAANPGRSPYLLRFSGDYHHHLHSLARIRLEQLAVVRAPEAALSLAVAPRGPVLSMRLVVTRGTTRVSYPLAPAGGRPLTLVLTPGSARVVGAGPGFADTSPAAPSGGVQVALLGVTRRGGREHFLDRVLLAARADGRLVDVLAPVRTVGTTGDGPPPALTLTLVPAASPSPAAGGSGTVGP